MRSSTVSSPSTGPASAARSVPHDAVLRGRIDPDRRALPYADIDRPVGAVDPHRAADDVPDAHGAVRRAHRRP